ncbi:hypothetical protein [uncultured Desulfovibrio sp.]|uniref:hypothetical protein n=1 Tax=uncultured Desulfovibrio sp. TaxID=167968 RepID=UPI002609994C|nr:hypothetical protein [uncultured Desulfovibrio sp.]
MYDFTTDETRIYAPAESADITTEGFPQVTSADTGWTDEERNAMLQHGYDGMDMLRAWEN